MKTHLPTPSLKDLAQRFYEAYPGEVDTNDGDDNVIRERAASTAADDFVLALGGHLRAARDDAAYLQVLAHLRDILADDLERTSGSAAPSSTLLEATSLSLLPVLLHTHRQEETEAEVPASSPSHALAPSINPSLQLSEQAVLDCIETTSRNANAKEAFLALEQSAQRLLAWLSTDRASDSEGAQETDDNSDAAVDLGGNAVLACRILTRHLRSAQIVLPRIRTKRFSALTSSFFSTLVELTINLGDLVDEHPAEADVNGVTYVLEGTSITLLALMQLINVSEVLQRRNTSKHNEVEAQSGVNQDVHRLFSAAIVHLSTLLPETAVLSDSAEHERMAAGAAMYQEANAKPCDVWPAIIDVGDRLYAAKNGPSESLANLIERHDKLWLPDLDTEEIEEIQAHTILVAHRLRAMHQQSARCSASDSIIEQHLRSLFVIAFLSMRQRITQNVAEALLWLVADFVQRAPISTGPSMISRKTSPRGWETIVMTLVQHIERFPPSLIRFIVKLVEDTVLNRCSAEPELQERIALELVGIRQKRHVRSIGIGIWRALLIDAFETAPAEPFRFPRIIALYSHTLFNLPTVQPSYPPAPETESQAALLTAQLNLYYLLAKRDQSVRRTDVWSQEQIISFRTKFLGPLLIQIRSGRDNVPVPALQGSQDAKSDATLSTPLLFEGGHDPLDLAILQDALKRIESLLGDAAA